MKKILLFAGLLSTVYCYSQNITHPFEISSVEQLINRFPISSNKSIELIEGIFPLSGAIEYNGKLYGMTMAGGLYGNGVIFEWNPLLNIYKKRYDFEGRTGAAPSGFLSPWEGKLYGYTYGGGSNGIGVIFEWDPATNIYTNKIDFSVDNGSTPIGSMKLYNGKFYGTTAGGGIYNAGVFFEWDPATNVYTKKNDFDVTNGNLPSYVTIKDGICYGIASGGANGCGVIYEYNITNSNFSKRFDFNEDIGSNPEGGLIFKDNKFYGVTRDGGVYKSGVIYEWDPATNLCVKKIDFKDTLGSYPNGPLTVIQNKLYGITGYGGNFNQGVLYEWDITKNKLRKKFDFNDDTKNGANPYGSLTLSQGTLYGVAFGGKHGYGVLYEWKPGDDQFTKKIDFPYIVNQACGEPLISNMLISTDTLWPPRHSLRGISVAYKTSGDCKCDPVTRWLTIKSNEPISGTGSADKSPDWVVMDANHVKLRAERDDLGNGRVYTITIHAQNTAGALSTYDFKVAVPLSISAPAARTLAEKKDIDISLQEDVADLFNCKISPIPSSQYFNLEVLSASSKKIEVTILDISGKAITTISYSKNEPIRFGNNLKPGVYMIKITQADQQKIIKVIKQ